MRIDTTPLSKRPDRHRFKHSFETRQDEPARSSSQTIGGTPIFARISENKPAIRSVSRCVPAPGETLPSPWESFTERDLARFVNSLNRAQAREERKLDLVREALSELGPDLARKYPGFSSKWSGIPPSLAHPRKDLDLVAGKSRSLAYARNLIKALERNPSSFDNRTFARLTSALYRVQTTENKRLGLAYETLAARARLDIAWGFPSYNFNWLGITAYLEHLGIEPPPGPDFVESYRGRKRTTEVKNSNGDYYLSQYLSELEADNYEISRFRSDDATMERMKNHGKTYTTSGRQIIEFPLNRDGSVKRKFREIDLLIKRSVEKFIEDSGHHEHYSVS